MKQTYKYINKNSIVVQNKDEYSLTKDEYYKIHSFFVTYSMCGNQSLKKRSFKDYGWGDNNLSKNTELQRKLVYWHIDI